MCLIVLAVRSHPAYKLVLAGNRDEFYDRPTAGAAFWSDAPDLLGGRDLRAGGTWLGITKQGRIAALTDYRDPASIKNKAPSRGKLVKNFLLSRKRPVDYLDVLGKKTGPYNGFNIIFGEKEALYWYSNRGDRHQKISSGIHGLSNHLLNTPWPKVIRITRALEHLLMKREAPSPESVFDLLLDRSIPDDERLPNTGVALEWERILSPIFVHSPIYGTRSSTVIFIDRNDRVTFIEKTYDSDPDHPITVTHEFQIETRFQE